MFAELHCTQSDNGVVVIGYSNRYSIKIFMFLFKHLAPVVIKSCFWKFFAAGRGHAIVNVAEKCNDRIFFGSVGIMMDIIFALSTAADGSDIKFVTRSHEALAQYMPRYNIKSGGCQGCIFNKLAPGNFFSRSCIYIFFHDSIIKCELFLVNPNIE